MNINTLMDKPIWQMTGREFCDLSQYAFSLSDGFESIPQKGLSKAVGVQALANELGCCQSTIYALMRATREDDGSSDGGGILRDAIISRIGRKIVFDVERARDLAKNYKNTIH